VQDIEGICAAGIPNRDLDALENFWQSCQVCKRVVQESDRPDYCI